MHIACAMLKYYVFRYHLQHYNNVLMITKKIETVTDNLYFYPCCGGRDRTTDLQVMSLTSYHCSTPRYISKTHDSVSNRSAKVIHIFKISKFFNKKVIINSYFQHFCNL